MAGHSRTRSTAVATCLALITCALLSCLRAKADDELQPTLSWTFSEQLHADPTDHNPMTDPAGDPVWHLLRTTSHSGPVESRRWLHDGQYVPLQKSGTGLFSSPVDGWAFRLDPPLAPLISLVRAEYDVGLRFQLGEVLIAPGPESAVVIGWCSPVSGTLEAAGIVEHAQNCCGVNSRIGWSVEHGSRPGTQRSAPIAVLASGSAEYGTADQSGRFQIKDLSIRAGEFLYFIVDALADGTATPHHGDATRFDVTVSVRNAVRPLPPKYETEIRPILARACVECHGEETRESQLSLHTISEILRGGENGPAARPGDPQHSLLVDLIANGQMPPAGHEPVTADEFETIRRWIRAGLPADEQIVDLPPRSLITAADRSFRNFQSPQQPPIPTVRAIDRVETPVDSFLLQQLESRGLTYSPDAGRSTLIRRAYFDLIGLPPDESAVTAFEQDPRPDAWERLIDELLQSPHYGERWGRHWLDAAGYVDGKLDNDLGTMYPSEGIWRYRDYVIRAFNEDLPYHQFLTQQLAGDELVDWRNLETWDDRTRSLLTATGFLRTVDDHTDFPQYGIEKRYEVINETLDMFSTAVLGLTFECCRCHNHKYDPIPQRDYYRLLACFEPAFNPHAWKPPKERFLNTVSPAEKTRIDEHNAELDRRISAINESEQSLRDQVRTRIIAGRLDPIPQPLQEKLRQLLSLPADRQTPEQQQLSADNQQLLNVTAAEIDSALTQQEQTVLQSGIDQRARLTATKQSYGVIQALWDVAPPPVSRIHRRGNVNAPGIFVEPGFPEVLQQAQSLPSAAAQNPAGETSGRRLRLAQWLTQPDHPLTARVIVNRVWHHHFGRGLVEPLGNFGRSGSPASHPDLLDWLAVDFIEHGWSLKHLHRRIMHSTAFRQSSRTATSAASTAARLALQTDPDNVLLWKMNLRRLEAETARDAILCVSGSLDRTAGGPPVAISNPADGLSQPQADASPTSPFRRSIYLFARRVYPLKFLEIFDAPIMPVNCTQRTSSATVLQSLALLNSEFLFAQSERMATRICAAEARVDEQIRYAFLLAFARPPESTELLQAQEFLTTQTTGYTTDATPADKAQQLALADFCHMLLSSNEFLYVE